MFINITDGNFGLTRLSQLSSKHCTEIWATGRQDDSEIHQKINQSISQLILGVFELCGRVCIVRIDTWQSVSSLTCVHK